MVEIYMLLVYSACESILQNNNLQTHQMLHRYHLLLLLWFNTIFREESWKQSVKHSSEGA